jgi:hydroxylaminobenzene mutase
MTNVEDSKRLSIWHEMFLFLLGLLTGFVEQQPHLEGVMNGTFLVALGAVWTECFRCSLTKQRRFGHSSVIGQTYAAVAS